MPGDTIVNDLLGCLIFFGALFYLGIHTVLLSRRISRALRSFFGYAEAPSTVDVTINEMFRDKSTEAKSGSEYRKSSHAIRGK